MNIKCLVLLESDSKTSCDNNTQQQPCLTACFSRTTWISQHQKGRTILDFTEARDDGVAVASA